MKRQTWYGYGDFIASPVKYCLCTNEKQLRNEEKHLNVKAPAEFMPKGAHAITVQLDSPKDDPLAIVCVSLDDEKASYESYLALIAHESAHIFQMICTVWGERRPSDEFMAYALQMITLDLFKEFAKQVGVHAITRSWSRLKKAAARSNACICRAAKAPRVDTATSGANNKRTRCARPQAKRRTR